MLQKWEIGEHISRDEQNELKEKIENTLCTLHELKERVAQLKRRCEEFRKMELERLENMEDVVKCDKCGQELDPNEQVAIKDADGNERKHYHTECFAALFK